MKRWLFTSAYRHWKNGEKDMAFKIWLINITIMVTVPILIVKWIGNKIVKDDIARRDALFMSDPDAWEAEREEHLGHI